MHKLKKQIASLPTLTVGGETILSYQAVTDAVAAFLFPADPPDPGDTAVTQQILETTDAICRDLGYRQVIKLTPPDVSIAETGLYWTKTDSADGDDTHILIHTGPNKADLFAGGRLFDDRLHELDLDEVTRQHFRIPVTASDEVIALLHRAVQSDWPNDYKGVWSDILGMCISGGRDVGPTERLFTVIIRGLGRRRYWSFRAEVNSSGNGAPFLYICLADEPRQQRTLFPLGHIVMTPGAAALHVDFAPYLTRHGLGDWGELCDFDAEQNDTAVQHGGRLLSAYTVPLGDGCREEIWVITESDRSATTILRPDEY